MNNLAFSVQRRKSAMLVMMILLLDGITKARFYNANVVLIPNTVKMHGTKNYGVAFSFLNSRPQYVIILSFLLIILVAIMLSKAENKTLNIGLSFVLGGALGNFFDRIIHGFVVDFIQTLFINFPVFNVADICITVGAILSCIAVLFLEKQC